MQLEEKLKHFYETTIATVQKENDTVLSSYEEELQALFHTYQKEQREEFEEYKKDRVSELKRTYYRDFSQKQSQLKLKLVQQIKEKEQELFSSLKQFLQEYRKTPDYVTLLTNQIHQAATFLKPGEKLVVYLDKEDIPLKEALAVSTDITPLLSDDIFLGGIRASIPNREVLIDYSFASKLKNLQGSFSFFAPPFDQFFTTKTTRKEGNSDE